MPHELGRCLEYHLFFEDSPELGVLTGNGSGFSSGYGSAYGESYQEGDSDGSGTKFCESSSNACIGFEDGSGYGCILLEIDPKSGKGAPFSRLQLELNLINRMSKSDLPLIIGSIEFDESKSLLEARLKQHT